MTICETIIVTIVGGIVSSIIANYIVRCFDNRHKKTAMADSGSLE